MKDQAIKLLNYPSDPKAAEPGWKNVTDECRALSNDLMHDAEELLGLRTRFVALRVTEFNQGPRTCFNDAVAYIRLGPGVGPRPNPTPDQARQLKHQLAFEMVHVLSVFPGAPLTALEKGAAAYFAVQVGGYTPQESGAPQQYVEAYAAVAELLDEYDNDAIKNLRNPLCSLNRITAASIRLGYPNCPEDLIARLTSEW